RRMICSPASGTRWRPDADRHRRQVRRGREVRTDRVRRDPRPLRGVLLPLQVDVQASAQGARAAIRRLPDAGDVRRAGRPGQAAERPAAGHAVEGTHRMAIGRLWSVTLDCADPQQLADFWAAALDGKVAYTSNHFV